MKSYKAQFAVAIVCMILGFLLAYQYKQMRNPYNTGTIADASMLEEIELLKKQKENMELKNQTLVQELKGYEDEAASTSSVNKLLKEQLDQSRLVLGLVDVTGEGVTMTLTHIDPILNQGVPQYLSDVELVHILNELKFAGAEAVSINNKRVTTQSGIKSSSNNSFILLNDEKISPGEVITINAIGDKELLMGALSFNGALDFQALMFYDIRFEPREDIEIPKFDKSFRTKFIRPMEKE